MVDIETCRVDKDVVVGYHIEVDSPHVVTSGLGGDWERMIAAEKVWLKELTDLLDEHKDFSGRFGPSFRTVRERRDECSACGEEWETYSNRGIMCCSSCGAVVEEREVCDGEV